MNYRITVFQYLNLIKRSLTCFAGDIELVSFLGWGETESTWYVGH
jgi:hypothetical protein